MKTINKNEMPTVSITNRFSEEDLKFFGSAIDQKKIYKFTHVDSLLLTKEEKEEIGKHEGKIDGIYTGEINYNLVGSGELKLKKQVEIEKIYNAQNPINETI